MIDIHSHLLPNVDDGSKSMTETLSLLNDAEKDGITEIILTPHFMKNGEFRIKAPELIEKFNILKNTYQGSIKLNLGNELYIHPDLPELLERNEVLTLSETDYILVEFPFVNYEEEYDEILYELSLKYKIIIAHPERYKYVQKNIQYCLKWLDEGYYLQSNQSSLFQKHTDKILRQLINYDFVSFIASDAHNPSRPLKLQNAFRKLTKEFGEKKAYKLIYENPKTILNNGEIISEFKKIKEKKTRFMFWK